MGKRKKLIINIISTIVSFLSVVLTLSICWMFATWNNLAMDELVYHLTSPLEGTNDEIVTEYIILCILPALIIAITVMIFLLRMKRADKFYKLSAIIIVVSLVISGISTGYAWNKLSISEFISAQTTESSFIEDNYISPSDIKLEFPEEKRNLIYIFLESMEITYSDLKHGGAFKNNVIPELTNLAEEYEDFSGKENKLNGGIVTMGTGWTMGAMFAHTSGLPLSVSIDANLMNTQDTFFSEAVTLGDILKNAGYTQALLIGSDATFGGRRLYFSEHGCYNIIDYPYAQNNGLIPEDYNVWWGYEDQKLFRIAKDKLTELSTCDEPFNLTILTVDTHFEDGYICEKCPDFFGDNQYANVMACSSRQIKNLISWIQQQDFYANTTIVLVGDHTTMDKDFCEDVDEDYVRKVYTCFINSDCESQSDNYRTYTTLDLYPTTLAALGVNIEGNRLGLGTNLFSDSQTLIERFGYSKIETEFAKKSVFIEQLANIDTTKKQLITQSEEYTPSADVIIEQIKTNTTSVVIKNIAGVPNHIDNVRLAVWATDDKADIQYIMMEKGKNGTFTISLKNKKYLKGKNSFYIEPFALEGTGVEYSLGEKQINVE